MIYKARVISNNDFSTTGKIKVRVFKETMPELWKPLTEIPDSIKEAKQIHGDKYDYSLVEYKGCRIKVKIICPKHGIFEHNLEDDGGIKGLNGTVFEGNNGV